MSEPTGPAEHYCTGCGQLHGGRDLSAEVKIAKINADRDVEVARIQRGEFQMTPLEAETTIAVTELEAAAAVEVAAELGDGQAPAAEEPETTAIVVEGPPAEPAEELPSIEPGIGSSEPPAAKSKSSLSYW
jgi:hypothetical protein